MSRNTVACNQTWPKNAQLINLDSKGNNNHVNNLLLAEQWRPWALLLDGLLTEGQGAHLVPGRVPRVAGISLQLKAQDDCW
eukprot:928703-Pelagomonas_calceolata.AAC.1